MRERLQLHPRIKAEHRISRTDIFEGLFAPDEDARHRAHEAFADACRWHCGEVNPSEGGELELLVEMHGFDIKPAAFFSRSPAMTIPR